MKKFVGLICAIFFVFGVAGNVQAVSMQDLFDGGSLTVGDNIFYDWTLDNLSYSGTSKPDLNQITVTPLTDKPLFPGIRYTANGELATSDGDYIALDYGFKVEAPLPQIDALQMTLIEYGDDSHLMLGNVWIVEDVYDNADVKIRTLTVGWPRPGGVGGVLGSQTMWGFEPVSFMNVRVHVYIKAEDTSPPITYVEVFDQRFRQLFPPQNQPPVAMCQDVTVMTNSACQGVVAPEDVDNGSYDPDGDAIALSLSPTGPYLPGTTAVTLTVSDGVETDTCEATVTVLTATDVTYDGDTLMSTEGNPTVDALFKATLRDENGDVFDTNDEEATFTFTAEGIGTIVVTAGTTGGIAEAVQALEPAIYVIEVSLSCSDATASAILVVYNPEGGFATGGGWIVPEDDGVNTHPNERANFGFNAKYKQADPTGHIQFRYSDGHIDLKSSSVEQLVITGGKIVQFKGWASVNGKDGHWFFVKGIDNGEPGTNDVFDIKIWAPGDNIDGDPSERAGGTLQGGNIVVHTK